MELYIPFATALLLGSLHAFEPDHMAAVTTFAVRRPRRAAAIGFGLRWAAGHGGVVLLAGAALLLLQARLDAGFGHWLERIVGLSLLALGAWNVAGARAIHAHAHEHGDGLRHVHLHSHAAGPDHHHGHAVTAIGALHGLAGTAPVLALLPLANLDSTAQGLGYLALFGVGTAAGMVLYASFAGWIAQHVAERSAALARRMTAAAGVATMIIGAFWLVR